MIPYGTNLYAMPPGPFPYSHSRSRSRSHSHHRGEHQYPEHYNPRTNAGLFRGGGGAKVFSRVNTGRDTRPLRHGRETPDLRVYEYADESESTQLGEMEGQRRRARVGMRGGQARGGEERRSGGDNTGAPPGYVSRESVGGFPYAAAPLSRSASEARPDTPRRVPHAIQAALDAALQQHARGDGARTRSKTAPAASGTERHGGWGEGIDTCICTTNCRCRKGERGTKWYKGVANIGGAQVPVRAKLNTRYVLADDIGKDCGDHAACRTSGGAGASASASASSGCSSDASSQPRKRDRRHGKKLRTSEKMKRLEARMNEMMRTQGPRYPPPSFPGHMGALDPDTLERMHMLDTRRSPYNTGGMRTTMPAQGMFDSLTTRPRRGPRMPPQPGMRMPRGDDGFFVRGDGDAGAGSTGTLFGRAARKGEHKASMLARGRARFDPQGGPVESDSEPSGPRHRSFGKGRHKRSHPRFELDESDVSPDPRRPPRMKGFGHSDGRPTMFALPSKPCLVSAMRVHVAEPLPGSDSGDSDVGASPQRRRPWLSPPGGGVRRRAAGKQARVETDEDS
ncbi:hypothetical protein C7974DRAFT_396321 [Boeremia exigua]|uniref:uncharacterized protein n=1 Tax=Boeremia exigua TaxID=749465 RepID=UPI001E8D6F5B|nr:uncharacterized protein C7974DRAFT_396321 [Boeremia exigua]KAH6625576.1 hypothetical protein C7974DRAFT_396321 [Boeremia exigua]